MTRAINADISRACNMGSETTVHVSRCNGLLRKGPPPHVTVWNGNTQLPLSKRSSGHVTQCLSVCLQAAATGRLRPKSGVVQRNKHRPRPKFGSSSLELDGQMPCNTVRMCLATLYISRHCDILYCRKLDT